MNNTKAFFEALLAVDKMKCAEILAESYRLEEQFSLVENIISDSLTEIGEGWEKGSVSLAQVYMSGVICEELVKNYLLDVNTKKEKQQKIAIGVLHDHHTLGKRIVLSIARANGYEIMDFGSGLTSEQISQLTVDNDIDILLISTLMLHAALKVKTVKEKLLERDCNAKVIVGGAPFRLDYELWKKVSADGYCKNAIDVLDFLKEEPLNDE